MRLRLPALPRHRRVWLAGLAGLLLFGASLVWPVPASLLHGGAVVSLRVTDRHGGLLREVQPDGRSRPVRLDAVDPAVLAALVATEDQRFYRHPGVDPVAIARAVWDNLRARRVVSGGSTLTMQVARTLRGATRRGWWDKLAEAHLAVRLEVYLTKAEILELWLNRVSFGNQAHGIEAAARLYFGKSARDLTVAEAAYLVGLPQSPSRYNPFRYPERARARQHRVLAAMEAAGALSAGEREHLEALPVALQRPEPLFRAPHFVHHLLAGVPPNAGLAEIRTTIDPALQQTVEDLLRGHLRLLRDASVTNAAAVVLDNRTGAVLAYAGSANFWDERTGGQNDGVRMLRQPGSALKPFTYAHALASRRYTPASILADVELQVLEAGGAFSPENYDRQYHGPVPLRQALASSFNVPAVRLAREIGPAALLRTLHAVGFASLRQPPETYGVGLTLGNGEVRLLELARAYAGLARGGTLPPIRTEYWRRTASGDTLYPALPPPSPTGIDPATAYLITDILSDPEARAPAFGRGGPLELPFPCAVKTGTSKDYRDNWTVGYTPRHTVAVWVGNFDGTPMRWVSGVSGAGPLFHAIMRALGSGGAFERPEGVVEGAVCPASGKRTGTACPGARAEPFLAGTVPTDTCDVHRRVHIDRRTGLLADATTPPDAIEERRYTVYPPLFHAWMRSQGLPFPPEVSYAQAAASDTVQYSDRLRILYPASGTTYRIDPVLRRTYQRIHLKAGVEDGLFDVAWWIDGQRQDGDYRTAQWTLQPGRHHVELRAVTGDGRRLRSRPVVITVAE